MNASDKVLDECMTMPGGGVHQVAAGQITDDGELMMCLLQGYANSNQEDVEPRKFDVNAVANMYGMWYNSDPFDMGRTTENAL